MRKIYKYPFILNGKLKISLPRQWHKIMHVGLDPNGQTCIWVMIHPEDLDDMVDVDFRIYGTGHDVESTVLNHIGTFVDSPCVWHMFIA